jgi:hypothetical protein
MENFAISAAPKNSIPSLARRQASTQKFWCRQIRQFNLNAQILPDDAKTRKLSHAQRYLVVSPSGATFLLCVQEMPVPPRVDPVKSACLALT